MTPSKAATKRRRLKSADIDSLTEALEGRLNAVMMCISNSWGGLEQVVAQDSTDIRRLGLKIRVLCLEGTPIYQRLKEAGEVELIPIHFRPRDFLDFKLRTEIRGLIAEGVNLIHTQQTSILGSIVPWTWANPNLVLVCTRHIMNNHDKRDIFHTALYSRIDSYMVMSQALKDNVLATHNLRERQMRIVHCGLDFDLFDPNRVDTKKQRAAWGADDQTVVIGLVGRIDPAKGQATFIKAAAGLMKESSNSSKLKFVIVGEETLGSKGGYLDELKAMVAQFRLEDHVLFTGFQEDMPAIMSAFDICVMPSRQEAFGLVAIEAMAMETPIIISSGGSSQEIVGREEYGLLVHPEDPYDLQRQLRHLIENPSDRRAMGRRAREHVQKNYDRDIRIQRIVETYEWCLRRRGM